MNTSNKDGLQFMSIVDGARHLGVSSLRLRTAALQGLVPARRDNKGHIRVDLSTVSALPEDSDRAKPLAPAQLMSLLFDEIEDLHGALAQKDAEIAALTTLVERQDNALERAVAVPTGNDVALTTLLDRAMALLETQQDSARQVETTSQMLDRALTLLDRTQSAAEARGAEVEAELGTTKDQLEQTMALSERAIERIAAGKSAKAEQQEGLAGLWARLMGR